MQTLEGYKFKKCLNSVCNLKKAENFLTAESLSALLELSSLQTASQSPEVDPTLVSDIPLPPIFQQKGLTKCFPYSTFTPLCCSGQFSLINKTTG
jgi:hypothetical protein